MSENTRPAERAQRRPAWQGRTKLTRRDAAKTSRAGSFVVVELEDRRTGRIVAVWQDIGQDRPRCTCAAFKHNADCRHVEIVEVARTLAGVWCAEHAARAAVLHLEPPAGSAPPTRLYVDEGGE